MGMMLRIPSITSLPFQDSVRLLPLVDQLGRLPYRALPRITNRFVLFVF
jgi:hypothetical protein